MSFATSLQVMVVMFLLETRWDVVSGTQSSPLKVANNLEHGSLTVLSLAGCCSPCGPNNASPVCLQYCAKCPDIVVGQGKVGEVDRHVGPFPLPYMMIQVKETVWCVEPRDLWMLSDSVTLAVGPDACGQFNNGLKAVTYKPIERPPLPVCMYVCNVD